MRAVKRGNKRLELRSQGIGPALSASRRWGPDVVRLIGPRIRGRTYFLVVEFESRKARNAAYDEVLRSESS